MCADLYLYCVTRLPVEDILPELLKALSMNSTVILQAPPGAGKSTWLPLQFLKESWLGGKKILMLEPRRLAARNVAARLARLLEQEVGETVGYRIRFEKKTSAGTRIEIITEGILTRMLQEDNALEGVGMIIFDEFHERSIHADLALALSREIQHVLRPDLRLLIMSATLDGEKLSRLLGNAPVVTSEGRQHPIKFHYAGFDEQMPLHLQMCAALRNALRDHDGDVLVFLPGAAEISRTQEELERSGVNAIVVPLSGDLSIQKQQEAIEPDKYGNRKIVLATSIAETSLTIQGIKVVIDCGFSRVPKFDPQSGLTKLQTIRVTRDSADQRAGRAGRLGPGTCVRLWTEGFDHHLVPHRSPEIEESDLASLVLECANWGVRDISTLNWITLPPRGAVVQAKELLERLGALHSGKITERGKEMVRLPAHPRLANMLLHARDMDLASLACDLCALIGERDPLGREEGVDIGLRIELMEKWRRKERVNADRRRLEQIGRSAEQWRRIMNCEKRMMNASHHDVGELIAFAFPERVAKRISANKFRMANGRIAAVKEHDPLGDEHYISICSLDAGLKGEAKIFLAAPLHSDVLEKIAVETEIAEWDEKKGELNVAKQWRVGDIILRSDKVKNVNDELRSKLLVDAIRKDHSLLPVHENFRELQVRILCLKKWNNDDSLPDLSEEYLFATMEEWITPYLTSARRKEDLQRIDLHEIFFSSLPYDVQQRIDELAPVKFVVPSGSYIKLQYHDDGSAPILAVRLQELFGMLKTPAINNGKTRLIIHLLSPAYRPVQVTQDLESFWKNTYAEVRKDLRSRYPKHSWPEDPYTAQAVRGVKRK